MQNRSEPLSLSLSFLFVLIDAYSPPLSFDLEKFEIFLKNVNLLFTSCKFKFIKESIF